MHQLRNLHTGYVRPKFLYTLIRPCHLLKSATYHVRGISMKPFRHSARQKQQVFAALALTSIVSLGSGVNLVSAAIAKSTEPVQGSVSEPLKLSSKDVASPKQLGNREIPVSIVNAVRREISSSYRIPPGQLKIVSYSSERWRDSCLGLGKPNESCAR